MDNQAEERGLRIGRAVASLLRLANLTINDADLLATGGHPQNAPILLHWAIKRLLHVVLATELGWPLPAGSQGISDVPDENPLKLSLARISKLSKGLVPPAPLPDGTFALDFDRDGFRRDLAVVKDLLKELCDRAGVDVSGPGSAARIEPARPPAASDSAKKVQRAKHRAPADPNDPSDPPAGPIAREERPAKNVSPIKAKRHREDRPRQAIADLVPRHQTVSSIMFWSVMDRWGVSDLAALQLLHHQGGLTRKGTRPRFRLQGEEAEMAGRLSEIDQSLSGLRADHRKWLNKPIQNAPFNGATLIEYLTVKGVSGAKDVNLYILKNGLKLSVSRSS
jgi:hypothetical protein